MRSWVRSVVRRAAGLGVLGLCALGALALLGCGTKLTLEEVAGPEDRAVASAALEALRHRDFEAVERATDESFRGDDLRPTLERLAARFPPGEPRSVELVGADRRSGPNGTLVVATWEYGYDGAWVLAAASLLEKAGERTIVGLQVEPQEQSLAALHRFTLAGKGAIHYLVLLGAAGALGLTLWTFVVYLRTEVPGWKWPWAPFILLGFGRFTLTWTTGQLVFDPLAVPLPLGVWASAPPHASWLVEVAVPLGAIVFLNQRRSWNRKPPELPRIATS